MVDKIELAKIDDLPDDVLLRIFFFHRPVSWERNRPPLVGWRWHTLTHVCRRWRRLIFSSPNHLGVRLAATPRKDREDKTKSAGRTTLDSWPIGSDFELPLSIWYDTDTRLSVGEEDDVVAMLEHTDRIRDIGLAMSSSLLSRSTAWTESSFPALETLHLQSPDYGDSDLVVLPSGFLGTGSNSNTAPPCQLSRIAMKKISFPALPRLLSSSDLVILSLGQDCLVGEGFLSPESLTAALSAATKLEGLYIKPYSRSYYPEQKSAHPPPPNPLVLRSLIDFRFYGSGEYLEDFVSRIDAPHLAILEVSLSRYIDDVPQLSQFISQIEQMRVLPHWVTIELYRNTFSIRQYFKRVPHCPETASLRLWYCDWRGPGWRVSKVHHICRRLSPLTFSVKGLKIMAYYSPNIWLSGDSRGDEPASLWLQLLRPFNKVETLELHGTVTPGTEISYALEQSTLEMAGKEDEVLPELCILKLYEFSTAADSSMEKFIAARQLSDRPLTVRRIEYFACSEKDIPPEIPSGIPGMSYLDSEIRYVGFNVIGA